MRCATVCRDLVVQGVLRCHDLRSLSFCAQRVKIVFRRDSTALSPSGATGKPLQQLFGFFRGSLWSPLTHCASNCFNSESVLTSWLAGCKELTKHYASSCRELCAFVADESVRRTAQSTVLTLQGIHNLWGRHRRQLRKYCASNCIESARTL